MAIERTIGGLAEALVGKVRRADQAGCEIGLNRASETLHPDRSVQIQLCAHFRSQRRPVFAYCLPIDLLP